MDCLQYAEYYADKNVENDEKQFYGRWLKYETPPAPSSIIWKNSNYSEANRLMRSIIIWILAVLVIIGAFYLMLYFKYINDEYTKGTGSGTVCPTIPVDAEACLDDWDKPFNQR